MSKPQGLTEEQWQLVAAAEAAYANSYSPYSGLSVGAALLTADGYTITGTNVENASFSLTLCAERAAIVNAVSQGHRDFAAMALIAKGQHLQRDQILTPCGACRQVLAEFVQQAGHEIEIVMASTDKSRSEVTTVAELLPSAMLAEAVVPNSVI